LDKGNYYGLEQHQWLIDAGKEIIGDNLTKKEPTFLVNGDFNFSEVGDIKFDLALSKSVFTHLTPDKIKQCLDNLKLVMKKDGVFFASIFIGDSSKNRKESDDTRRFMYSLEEIKELAEGWEVESLGNKGCYYQTMLKFILV
jgi:cyclopropane fatty-acyl-phospholipid synthase-like methyltransferase